MECPTCHKYLGMSDVPTPSIPSIPSIPSTLPDWWRKTQAAAIARIQHLYQLEHLPHDELIHVLETMRHECTDYQHAYWVMSEALSYRLRLDFITMGFHGADDLPEVPAALIELLGRPVLIAPGSPPLLLAIAPQPPKGSPP